MLEWQECTKLAMLVFCFETCKIFTTMGKLLCVMPMEQAFKPAFYSWNTNKRHASVHMLLNPLVDINVEWVCVQHVYEISAQILKDDLLMKELINPLENLWQQSKYSWLPNVLWDWKRHRVMFPICGALPETVGGWKVWGCFQNTVFGALNHLAFDTQSAMCPELVSIPYKVHQEGWEAAGSS